ncbi:MAG: hypothetical protein Q8S21_00495 [Candidatus Paracaedibacteraceae bacterium]|nr:hypothetical protein [Candidatus Paracaedibacteraceae bacterium]
MNMFNHEHDIESILFHQVRPNIALSPRIERALCHINRVPFLPPSSQDVAYSDAPINLKHRCEMPFFVIAQILESLSVQANESACVVSAGTGYTATLLSELCNSVEACESISSLFARLLDTARSNKKLTPVSVLSDAPVHIILMDGGSIDTISEQVLTKLLPAGRLAYIRPISMHNETLDIPLCEVIILEKTLDGSFKNPHVLTQVHLPRLNNRKASNQSFLF